MTLTGRHYLDGTLAAAGTDTFSATNPATGAALSPEFHEATPAEVDRAVRAAHAAFPAYRQLPAATRADFLDAVADAINGLGDVLIERALAETGLPVGRLTGERGRTTKQLRQFADLLREGSWVEARIDPALPDREPTPRADIRSVRRPLGVVAVFGASNFPLAFSVAGGDTASALAAGCPVVVKGHPSHPGTCELVARAVGRAVAAAGLPAGVFSLVQGRGKGVGAALVEHPLVRAVGFTGSFRGGKALFDLANRREEPIPVYAEMGSTNPVFILPGALAERGAEIAAGLTQSVTLGVGQFCTNPGIVFLGADEAATATFHRELATRFGEVASAPMLNAGIQAGYHRGAEALADLDGVEVLARGEAAAAAGCHGTARVLAAPASLFLTEPLLEEEVFGPSTIVFTTGDRAEMLAVATKMRGHLTATLFGTEADLRAYAELADVLAGKAGRLIVNQFPTGVEVGHAMVHGGPYPATTDPRTTSVGTAAIVRFTRPVCYQNLPQHLLPSPLRDENPGGIMRLVDGQWTRRKI